MPKEHDLPKGQPLPPNLTTMKPGDVPPASPPLVTEASKKTKPPIFVLAEEMPNLPHEPKSFGSIHWKVGYFTELDKAKSEAAKKGLIVVRVEDAEAVRRD